MKITDVRTFIRGCRGGADALAIGRQWLFVRVDTGERLYFRWGYKDLLARRLVDVIQPDICHGGGISELRRIAAAAETEHVTVAPHNLKGPVACAASVQLCGAIPNFHIRETSRVMHWHERVQKDPLRIVDGYFELPIAPGLGIDLESKSSSSGLSMQARTGTVPSMRTARWQMSEPAPAFRPVVLPLRVPILE